MTAPHTPLHHPPNLREPLLQLRDFSLRVFQLIPRFPDHLFQRPARLFQPLHFVVIHAGEQSEMTTIFNLIRLGCFVITGLAFAIYLAAFEWLDGRKDEAGTDAEGGK